MVGHRCILSELLLEHGQREDAGEPHPERVYVPPAEWADLLICFEREYLCPETLPDGLQGVTFLGVLYREAPRD